ncbi:MAG TPA: N,N-dimethylformamidase beta subunit family domain-containing protein, partial [Chryseosolibacter sp.]
MKRITSRKTIFPFDYMGNTPGMLRVLTVCILFAGFLSIDVEAQKRSGIIDAENAKPGTTDWLITKVVRHEDEPYEKGWHRRKEIEGFVSHTSIKAGETLKVYVSTEPADKYKLDIYRMGYYGGKGGRLVKSFNGLKGIAQPTPEEGVRSLLECKWQESASFKIPEDWVS